MTCSFRGFERDSSDDSDDDVEFDESGKSLNNSFYLIIVFN